MSEVRRYGHPGNQLVIVDGRYTYRWTGDEPLKVGDKVRLPENYVSAMLHGPGPFPGVVTELGTTYTGRIANIVSRLE